MKNSFLQRLGITIPILQAPMAGSTTPELTAAVANAGALGGHGCAALDVETTRQHIHAIRSLTTKPFNVNLFCHQSVPLQSTQESVWTSLFTPYFEAFGSAAPTHLSSGYVSLHDNAAMVEMLLEEKPPVLSFHFGLPKAEVIAAFKAAGIILLGCATRVEEAQAIEAAGLDAIIVQGHEAGGHQGVFDARQRDFMPLENLLKYVGAVTQLPLIAAGGIMTGAHIAKALKAGASAAQLGTAFLLCPETNTSATHRQALKQGKGSDTALIRVVSGRPARGFVNRLHQELDKHTQQMPPYPYPYSITKALNKVAAAEHNWEFAVHWAGTGVAQIREMDAAELVAVLEQERIAAG